MRLVKQTKGGALLTALFIMTLVAIVATAMTTRLQLDIYRTRLIITHDRLYLASQAVTFWGLTELNNPKNLFRKIDAQGRVAQFPAKLASLDKQVALTGALFDLQSRFNLNNVQDRKAINGFIALLKSSQQSAPGQAENIAKALHNWLSAYDPARGEDIYLSYYLKQKPPYYPGYRLMQSSSELRLIKDVTADLFNSLSPSITALPEKTAINMNTASKNVIKTLGNGLNDEQVNELLTAREDAGLNKLTKINVLLQGMNVPNEQITLDSQYFLIVANARTNEFDMSVYSLVKRAKNPKGKLMVSIIRQSINGM